MKKKDDLDDLFKKMKKLESNNYPEFNKRRIQFKFWVFLRNPAGCFLFFVFLAIIGLLIANYFGWL